MQIFLADGLTNEGDFLVDLKNIIMVMVVITLMKIIYTNDNGDSSSWSVSP